MYMRIIYMHKNICFCMFVIYLLHLHDIYSPTTTTQQQERAEWPEPAPVPHRVLRRVDERLFLIVEVAVDVHRLY